ncbi:MAG: VOC family protein [Sphingobacteriaceae bacterium]
MKKLYFASFIAGIALMVFQNQAFGQKKLVTRINHIAFYVVDLKKSTAFYKDALQLEMIPEPFKDGKHTWFSIGDYAHLHLIQGAAKTEAHDKNTHLCFSVASVDEFVKTLDKMKINYESWAGDPKTKTVRVDGVKQVYFQDPDGYWIEVNDDNK